MLTLIFPSANMLNTDIMAQISRYQIGSQSVRQTFDGTANNHEFNDSSVGGLCLYILDYVCLPCLNISGKNEDCKKPRDNGGYSLCSLFNTNFALLKCH